MIGGLTSRLAFLTLNFGMKKTNTRFDKKSSCGSKKSLVEYRNDETRRLNTDMKHITYKQNSNRITLKPEWSAIQAERLVL